MRNLLFLTVLGVAACNDATGPDGDSRAILFSGRTASGDDVYVVMVESGQLEQLTSDGMSGRSEWSPDGTRIAFESRRGLSGSGVGRIFVMGADGSDQHRLTNLGGANFAPFFHPSGERIIFASNHEEGPRSRNFDLYMVNLDGTDLTKVTHTPTFDGFPMFSPDGTKLVFASNRHGSVEGETNIFIADWIEPGQ